MPSTDITYCTRVCGNMECKRNRKQFENEKYTRKVWMTNFEDCKEWRKKDEV